MTELEDGPSFGVRGIVEDKDGRFWFSNTIHRYDVYPADSTADERSAAKYSKEPGIGQSGVRGGAVCSHFVSALKGRDDALWFATYGAGGIREIQALS